MHYTALMGEILQIVGEDADKHGFNKIEKVELTVGEISNAHARCSNVDIWTLQGTKSAFFEDGVKLLFHVEKAEAECLVCRKIYVPDHRISFCLDCCLPSGKNHPRTRLSSKR